MTDEPTLLGIALVERVLLEDVSGIQEIIGVIGSENLPAVMQFLASVLAHTLVRDYGLVNAVEQVHDWRTAALLGMSERDA